MTPVYIASAGIISPLGAGLSATEQALRNNRSAIAPLQIFALLQGNPLPVGQIPDFDREEPLPRAHRLACEATRMAIGNDPEPPDAVIIGCTTGGILTTEQLLRECAYDKASYRHHGLLSVAEEVATACNCPGPALTISTACSSSAVAIALALNLLRTGRMQRILVGGVDSLSRLTYFGFHSLQLVDPQGSRPLDVSRQGISVAEGAAMLLLTTTRPEDPLAVLLGAGLSCDAYHPTAPHPEGHGARAAMQAALTDAALTPAAVDYINLHGTGTPDNDLAECRAIRALFASPPPLSSIKGATGHSLAAAGAIEAVVASLAISQGFIPANTECQRPDPALELVPQNTVIEKPVRTVLSNSFGFGGNNASVVIGAPDSEAAGKPRINERPLAIHGLACLSGAGATEATLTRLGQGETVAGTVPMDELVGTLPPRLIRRVKRLARLALLLATSACDASKLEEKPTTVFAGTGWGALSETYDFLDRLFESHEQFPSPTDFVGSVHNGAASQIAMLMKATGANVTVSGGDYSFEQALLAAESLLDDTQSALILGLDEGHSALSPLLDPSITSGSSLADGGGAFHISRNPKNARCFVRLRFYRRDAGDDLSRPLLAALEGGTSDIAAIFAGIPAGQADRGRRQLGCFLQRAGQKIPVCLYRHYTGEFASAGAVAAALAASCCDAGFIAGGLTGTGDIALEAGHKIVVLGTGSFLTAMEFYRP